MPWYKTGTVSVAQNSNAVIGTGTAFIANGRVGDAFLGPDGGWHEVTNIASDTAISIDPPYQGANNAAGAYALAPMQGYVKDSADALRTLVNTYGAQLAALGTTGNYEVLPVSKGGTGIADLSGFIQGLLNDADAATARQTLVAAKSGANSDITALTALSTALSLAQGGTGGTTALDARTSLGLGSASVANVNGTQASGALFTYISNAAGEAWQFASGQMISIRTTSYASIAITTAAGSMFSSSGTMPILGYAAPFISAPVVHINIRGANSMAWHTISVPGTTSDGPSIYILSPTSFTGSIIQYQIAIGRWK
ncbi:hypothetical protein PS870_01749 [Pseudomonas fluorescens]|uniref:Tail fiber protein n=1 Tax=Pseudomonas fluorescens TaxID=294 RepID=A0A5E7JAD8_PSEFL|nr:phage tail protein [Pseudomonas fluorescens]VVO80113.1 hypothetical protein PS870_01749 [Pseudomonas fluorescens]